MTIVRVAKHGVAAYIPSWLRDQMELAPGQRITWTVSKDGNSATFTIEREAGG